MTARTVLEATLLGMAVLSCWLGAIGAFRMREPMQGLHFCTLPAAAGAIAVTLAIFVAHGSSAVAWKSILITAILLVINSVGMHASGRAFRSRELGHWEPQDGDSFEWVQPAPDELHKTRPQ